MKILNIKTYPYNDQISGTSGLRKKTKTFLQEHYLQNYVQSVCNAVIVKGKTLVIGGDGRFFNRDAVQIVTSIAIANGAKKIFIAQFGYLSTPAASIFIRKYNIDYGIILSASHNPAGQNGDFGIKINDSSGAPLDITTSNKITELSNKIDHYLIVEDLIVDIKIEQSTKILDTTVEIFNGITDYTLKMQEIFDFSAINKLINKQGLNFYFNALNAITGPYAYDIFHNHFNVPLKNLLNIEPKEDFGGIVADPNPTTSNDFIKKVQTNKDIQLGFACDADGDRNMICSSKHCLEPSDSIALILKYSYLVDYYKPLLGVARSLPTSCAVSFVASDLGVPCYIVPTGWKFFTNLLQNNKISFCGEESFGTGSNHSREKDGIWAILMWLHILAKSGKGFDEILEDFWQEYGRVFFSRFDVKDVTPLIANQVLLELETNAKANINKELLGGYIIKRCEHFNYTDTITKENVKNQGLVITFNFNAEVVVRLSDTGTTGSTIRFYFSQHDDKQQWQQDKFIFLESLIDNIFSLITEKFEYNFRV